MTSMVEALEDREVVRESGGIIASGRGSGAFMYQMSIKYGT
jgi:hypothetical protein